MRSRLERARVSSRSISRSSWWTRSVTSRSIRSASATASRSASSAASDLASSAEASTSAARAARSSSRNRARSSSIRFARSPKRTRSFARSSSRSRWYLRAFAACRLSELIWRRTSATMSPTRSRFAWVASSFSSASRRLCLKPEMPAASSISSLRSFGFAFRIWSIRPCSIVA